MTENCKLRKAILSAFYNILQRNFGILLILCLDLLSSKFWLIGEWSIYSYGDYLIISWKVTWVLFVWGFTGLTAD
jgi:hypothetical protein